MLGHYFALALRSFRNNIVLTSLMLTAIGVGVGASMTMITVLHVLTGDPLPGRSATLFTPHIDPLPLKYKKDPAGIDPSDLLTYPDAMALLEARKADRQAAMAGASLPLTLERAQFRPFTVSGRFTTSDFFTMFGVPLESGRGWSDAEGKARARVVVLSSSLSRKLFGSEEAIGQTIRLSNSAFTVIGVAKPWAPKPMFYADPNSKVFGDPDAFFLPLATAIDLKLDAEASFTSWGTDAVDNFMTDARTSWLQFWVQIGSAEGQAKYVEFLRNYSAEQIRLGRFERPADSATLYTLKDWVRHENLVPRDVHLQVILAIAFLAVCIINIMALLLTKFMNRTGEVGLRRALGASTREVMTQFSVEALMIGIGGGGLGILAAQFGLWIIRQRPDDYARLAQMDVKMIGMTIVLAIMSALAAGLFPAWRISRIPPALQLKEG